MEQALSNITLNPDTETEIRNAAYAGKEITTHQYQIDFNGWIGEGYIIIDPETGAGAYKIAGGGSGVWTWIRDALNALFGALGISTDVLDFIFKDGPFGIIGNIISVLQTSLSVVDIYLSCSGVDVIIALIPIITLILFISMFLGPVAFVALHFVLRAIMLSLAVWAAEQGTETLVDWHCK